MNMLVAGIVEFKMHTFAAQNHRVKQLINNQLILL